tara:strand:+ start:939 stop:1184 length:246 start_codon:yes stop_codon:yes gene_type:complete
MTSSREQVIEIVIKPLLALYKQPAHWDSKERLEAARESYIDSLIGFEPRALREAIKCIRAKHAGWEIPPPAIVVREANYAS